MTPTNMGLLVVVIILVLLILSAVIIFVYLRRVRKRGFAIMDGTLTSAPQEKTEPIIDNIENVKQTAPLSPGWYTYNLILILSPYEWALLEIYYLPIIIIHPNILVLL